MTNMKRCLSDSENDDLYDDDIKDGSPSQSCHVSDRKKRRGVIEKRRRDRINNSLTELRRLVPAAFEKQGSAKLEKAEILQMAVDHLKMLHSKGINGYNLDTAALAMDYRSVGFRECAAEVARYLVAVEGMDIQDPLRLRLLSHLQCYSAQREAAAKASLTNTFQGSSWNHMSHHTLNSQYNSGAMGTMTTPTPASMIAAQHGAAGDQLTMTSHQSALSTSSYTESGRLSQQHTDNSHMASGMTSMRLGGGNHHTSQVPGSAPSMLSNLSQVHSQFPGSLGMNSVPMLSPTGTHYTSSSMTSLGQAAVKPYRPWGTELAY